jgi:hypothetical protein
MIEAVPAKLAYLTDNDEEVFLNLEIQDNGFRRIKLSLGQISGLAVDSVRILRAKVTPPTRCAAIQYSDQMICPRCDLTWDTNTIDAPACKKNDMRGYVEERV